MIDKDCNAFYDSKEEILDDHYLDIISDIEREEREDKMKNLVNLANDAYYNSEEKIISDSEFNLLSDHGLETTNFRNKVEHHQLMGSLKKIKTEKDYLKWVSCDACMSGKAKMTPKLDGNSIELVYDKGNLIQAITRGDGFVGNDVTNKIIHCNVPLTISINEKVSIKCEAIMKKEHQKDYDKNIRNVVAGVLNRKSIIKEELNKIDIIAFEDLDYVMINSKSIQYDKIEAMFDENKTEFGYEIDGLVLELEDHIHEETNPLIPANIIALKFNKEGVNAEIGDIEWSLGKHSKLTPVIILKEGVDIDGTTVRRVSASNWSLLLEAGLGIGAKIQVIKSGDIIPFISKVVQKSDDHIYPNCPVCGHSAELNESEVQMICDNPSCKGKALVKLQHVFSVFDLDYISDSTIETLYNYGLDDLSDLFELTVSDFDNIQGFGDSKSNNFVSKLKTVILNEAQVLKCAMVQGISESNGQKFIDHYGSIIKFIKSRGQDHTVIDGIGYKMTDIINMNMDEFISMFNVLKKYITITSNEIKIIDEEKPNIVFTGKCKYNNIHYNRTELTDILEDKNFNVQTGINKDTNILLVADINSSSSKTIKAHKLGIKIISYDDFFVEHSI